MTALRLRREGKLLFRYHNVRGHTRCVYRGGRLISETTEPATTYSLTDVLGSPVAKTSAIGTLISRTQYEPYGSTASGVNPSGIGFTGHVNDVGTGLVYMQQRYYDPVAGRFLSVDPQVTDAKTGKDFNRYSYVNNNPYRYIDPTGELPEAVERLNEMVIGPYGKLADQAFSQGNYLASGAYTLAGAAYGVANVLTLGQGATAVKLGATATAKLGEAAAAKGFGEASSLVNAARLRGELAGKEIAGGHAFEKHVLNQGKFKGLGIRTREQLANHIEDVVNNSTASRQLSGGRTAYWQDSTGTVVIRNPRAADGGTAFQPTNGRAYFDGLR